MELNYPLPMGSERFSNSSFALIEYVLGAPSYQVRWNHSTQLDFVFWTMEEHRVCHRAPL